VGFGDDDFLVRPKQRLEEFAVKYRRAIDLPFTVTTNANAYRKEKFKILLDAGMKHVQIGVQSGSQRILDSVFNWKATVQKTKNVAREIVSFKDSSDLMLALDFIIDNPYETDEDIIDTYKYFLDLPLGIRINVSQWHFRTPL
jgi:anaerobic magnesium-protoporphyrin IX monomethyl ester cyclase